jgi:hypothetical protein
MWLNSHYKVAVGTHRQAYWHFGVQPSSKLSRFRCGFKRTGGRGITGQRTVFSKGRCTNRAVFKLTHWGPRGLFVLSFVTFFLLRQAHAGLLALVRNAFGA